MDSVILEKTRSEVKFFHFDFRGTHPNSILVNYSDELESNGSVGLEERIIFVIPRKTENWEIDNQKHPFVLVVLKQMTNLKQSLWDCDSIIFANAVGSMNCSKGERNALVRVTCESLNMEGGQLLVHSLSLSVHGHKTQYF